MAGGSVATTVWNRWGHRSGRRMLVGVRPVHVPLTSLEIGSQNMLDNHGDRIAASTLVTNIALRFNWTDQLMVMVGKDGQASLMSWDMETGKPSPVAIDIPVFTQLPDFYERPDAPRIDADMTMNVATEPVPA